MQKYEIFCQLDEKYKVFALYLRDKFIQSYINPISNLNRTEVTSLIEMSKSFIPVTNKKFKNYYGSRPLGKNIVNSTRKVKKACKNVCDHD